jgi:hypothetical protein
VTWYTWLEQARDVHPSRQVLDALAATLHLSPTEHHYLLSVAGFAPGRATDSSSEDRAPAHIQHLLDALTGSPAFAIGSDWTISGWNDAYAALYPAVATLPPTEVEALRPELKAAQAAIRRCERLGGTIFALNDVYATRHGYGPSGHFTVSDAAGVLKARV